MKVYSMKLILLSSFFLLLVSCSTDGNSVSCDARLGFDESAGDVLLTSQKQINNWDTEKTRVQGNLFIGYCSDRGREDINDLNGLNSIIEIEGDLIISGNANLTSVQGLENLERVGGNILLLENIMLTSLEGLQNLREVGGTLSIQLMDGLDNINTLSGLESIGGLNIWSNARIKNIDGLSNLSNLQGPVAILGNKSLLDLEGLTNVASSSIELLRIESNDELVSLDGLEGIEVIASDGDEIYSRNLTIYRNPKLTSIDALSNLTNVEGSVEVRWNTNLPSIEGLSGLTGANGLLWITENPLLTSLDGLRNISNVSGSLVIFDNDQIPNLDGLQMINSIGTTLSVYNNDNLTDLCGLTTVIQAEDGLNEGMFTTNSPYFEIFENGYNPTREDLENDICAQ